MIYEKGKKIKINRKPTAGGPLSRPIDDGRLEKGWFPGKTGGG